VVHAEERYRITTRAAAIVAELVTAAEERVSAGAALRSDRALAAAALARSGVERRAAESARRRARVALASLWGDTAFNDPVSRNAHATHATLAPDAVTRWAADSPSVVLARAHTGALRAEYAVEKSLRVPSVTAGVGIRRVEMDDAGTFLIGMSMPLPLWDRRGDAVQAADARVRAAELITRQLGAQVAADLANRLDALTQLLAQVEQTDTRVIPQLTAAADELRTAYLQGRASYPDLIEVQRTLVAVEQEQNDARRAIVDAMVAIEALTGTTIQEMQHE
jgi:cobalt-zinc-cadmium efflux system outer membrane protein